MQNHQLNTAYLIALLSIAGCGGGGENHSAPGASQGDTTGSNIPAQGNGSEKPDVKTITPHVDIQAQIIAQAEKNAAYAVIRPHSDSQHQLDKALQAVNELRQEKGLSPLATDPTLNAYAQKRAQEIVLNFRHARPDGESALAAINAGYSGENIAAGNKDGRQVVMKQWRNSPGHYKNMINANFGRIGMGFYIDPKSPYHYYWVQVFADKNGHTKYYFSDNSNQSSALLHADEINDIQRFLERKIIIGRDSRLALAEPDQTANTRQPRHDSAIDAFNKGYVQHPAFSQAIIYRYGQFNITLRDPKKAGWAYQTFGEITDQRYLPVAYVNVGMRTETNKITQLKAHYNGVMQGNYARNMPVLAQFDADVDFTGRNKTMNIVISDAKIQNAAGEFLDDAQFNFRDTLKWVANERQFVSKTAHAALYGGSGEEVGGQFSRMVNQKPYQGAFAGKK